LGRVGVVCNVSQWFAVAVGCGRWWLGVVMECWVGTRGGVGWVSMRLSKFFCTALAVPNTCRFGSNI
jgi:hypothetical protein